MSAEVTITYHDAYDDTSAGWYVEVEGLPIGTGGKDDEGHPDFWDAFQAADKWCHDRGHGIWRVTLEASRVASASGRGTDG